MNALKILTTVNNSVSMQLDHISVDADKGINFRMTRDIAGVSYCMY